MLCQNEKWLVKKNNLHQSEGSPVEMNNFQNEENPPRIHDVTSIPY